MGTTMVQVERLIADLAAEGEVDSKGGFTLDRAKAREKMRRFQLADPHRWVLLVVEALVARGATRVDVHIDADDVIVTGGARPLPKVIAENPWGAMFAEGEIDPGTRELALALNAIASLQPRWARLESGDGQRLHVVEIRPKGGDALDADEVFSERTDSFAGIRVHFKRTLGRAFSNFLWGETFARDEQPERKLLRRDTRFSHVPVIVDGETVSHGWGFATGVEISTAETAPPKPRLGVDVQGKRGFVYLVSHGVTLERKRLETGPGKFPPGFVALLDASAMDKDVSHARIVEDARWDEAMHRLRQFEPHLDLAIATWAATAGNKITRRLVDYLRVQLAYYSDKPALVKTSRQAAEAFALLSALRLWETIDHDWVSADEVKAAPGICGYVTKPPRWNRIARVEELDPATGAPPPNFHAPARPPADVGMLFLAADGSPEAEQFIAVFGDKGRSVDEKVREAVRREAAIDAWRRRPLAPSFGEGAWRGRAAIDGASVGEGVRGEVVLRYASGSSSSVALTRDAHVLFALDLRGIDGVAAVVEAPFTTTSDWTAPIADTTFTEVMFALGRAIVAAVFGGEEPPGTPGNRAGEPERELFAQLCVAATDTNLGRRAAVLRLDGDLGEAEKPGVEALQRGLMYALGIPKLTLPGGDVESFYRHPIATTPWLRTPSGFTSLARWRAAALEAGRKELRLVEPRQLADVPSAWSDVFVADEPLRVFLGLVLPGFTIVDVAADLRAYAERAAFLRKPIRAITALGNFEGARFPARFEDAESGLEGEIAMDDPRESSLRIACLSGEGAVVGMGRVLTHEKTMLALPGWVAVVAGSGVRPTATFAGVERESLRTIRRVVRRAIASRVVEFARALAQGQDIGVPERTMRPIVVEALRHLRGLANGEEGIRDLMALWREREPELLAAPIVPTCRGAHLTLQQIAVVAEAHELVFAGSAKEAEGEPDPVLLLDERMLDLVTTSIERDRLLPLGTVRARRRLDAKLAAAPVVARLDLSDEDVLARVPLGGMPGEVGIPRLHPRSAVETRVVVTSRRRILCEIRPEFELPLRGIVDAGLVDYDANRDKLPHGVWKRIVSEMRKALGALMSELCRRAPELGDEDRRLAGTWVLAEVARRAPGCAAKPASVKDGLARELLDAPVFRDGHGLWRPLRAFASSGPLVLRSVFAPTPELSDEAADPLVFVEATGEREWLHRIFPAIEEELDRAHRLRGLAERLESLPTARPPQQDAVITRSLKPKGEVRLSGNFWLPQRLHLVRGVECTHEGRVVGVLEVDLPCDGVIEIEAHSVPSEARAVLLSSGERHRIRKAVHELWKDLVERGEKADKARRDIDAAPLLADMCVYLAADRAANPERDDERLERLYERLVKLHVFPMQDGQRISYLKGMASHPRVVRAWKDSMGGQATRVEDRATANAHPGAGAETVVLGHAGVEVRGPGPSTRDEGVQAPSLRREVAPVGESIGLAQPTVVETQVSRDGEPDGPARGESDDPRRRIASLEARWLDEVRAALRWHQPTSAPAVESLAADVLDLRDLDGRRIVRVTSDGASIDRRHALVQAALAAFATATATQAEVTAASADVDASRRVAQAIVVSTVYSAINLWAASITDAHEQEFQASLLRSLLPVARADS